MKCLFCKEEIQENSIKCKHCGEILKNEEYQRLANKAKPPPLLQYTDSSEFYKRAFKKIDANRGKFTPTWNWASFFFGIFWYFYKGMWGKGLIMILISFFLAGIPLPLCWIYCGMVANYDYYIFKIKDKQLW